MSNVELHPRAQVSPFRKLALGTWRTTYDPSIYGTMRVRADQLLDYITRFRAATGHKLTATHVVAWAIGKALRACPEANAILRWNHIYPRKDVDVSILVLMEDGGRKDLSSAKIKSIDQKSLAEVIAELADKAQKIRSRQDQELEGTRRTMGLVPSFLIYYLLNFLSFLMYSLNLDLRRFGLPKDAFGSAVVTSIGSIGLQTAYVPLVPYTRVPIFVAPGEIKREPVVEGDRIVIGHTLDVNVTFDHRIIDGGHAADLARTVRRALEDPFAVLDKIP
jgi:pyruvate dehydrogenase E2 component (dihydrolipoamide acetyltransferase)